MATLVPAGTTGTTGLLVLVEPDVPVLELLLPEELVPVLDDAVPVLVAEEVDPPLLLVEEELVPELDVATVAACAVDPPAPQPARCSAHTTRPAAIKTGRNTCTGVTSKRFSDRLHGRTASSTKVLNALQLFRNLWKTP